VHQHQQRLSFHFAFSGTLTQLDAPGHFKQQLYFFGIPGPSVDYNVIYIDDEVAVEYDCNDSWLFGRDYCVHILSRKPTLSQEKVDEMIAFSEGLGLNTDNIAYLAGDQDGCW